MRAAADEDDASGRLPRDVKVLALTGGLILLADELWYQYLPKYLELLGASALAIGAFGTLSNLLDAVYMYPGGAVTDRVGPRRALVLFTLMAAAGFAIYALAPSWEWVFVGLFLATAWDTLARPASTALVKEAMPGGRAARGIAWTEVPRRAAFALGPPLGAGLIAALGFLAGLRVALAVTVALSLVAAWAQHRWYAPAAAPPEARLARWRDVPEATRRLLYADTLVRFGNGVIYVFVVLYVLDVLGATPWQYGLLIALEMGLTMLLLVPGAAWAERAGYKPPVVMTFAAFALFPVALTLVPAAGWWLVPVFALAGLRHVGDGAHKALIVADAPDALKGGVYGVYYALRNGVVIPSAAVGGLLYSLEPAWAFWLAAATAGAGALLFAVAGREPAHG